MGIPLDSKVNTGDTVSASLAEPIHGFYNIRSLDQVEILKKAEDPAQ